jgi:serine protease AprX
MVQMWSDNVWNTDPTGSTVFQRQPHASTIKALLINNAQQYTFSGTGHDLTRTHQGWGRPSVQVARERAAASIVVDEEAYLAQGQKATYPVDVVPGQSELKVTMTYPDPPGTPSASLHRVNDLSLKVTSPSGAVYHGNNGLLAGNYSTPGGSPNTIDTVENVFVANPEAGSWTVEVAAAAINQDGCRRSRQIDSVFALVVTGATLGEARTRPTAP